MGNLLIFVSSFVSPINDDERSAIISLKIPDGVDTGEVVKQLQDEYGILVTNRSGFLRVSPHIDNTPEQITFFLTSLRKILNIRTSKET